MPTKSETKSEKFRRVYRANDPSRVQLAEVLLTGSMTVLADDGSHIELPTYSVYVPVEHWPTVHLADVQHETAVHCARCLVGLGVSR